MEKNGMITNIGYRRANGKRYCDKCGTGRL